MLKWCEYPKARRFNVTEGKEVPGLTGTGKLITRRHFPQDLGNHAGGSYSTSLLQYLDPYFNLKVSMLRIPSICRSQRKVRNRICWSHNKIGSPFGRLQPLAAKMAKQNEESDPGDVELIKLRRDEFYNPARFWKTVGVSKEVRSFGKWRRNSYGIFIILVVVTTICTIALAPNLACAALYRYSSTSPTCTFQKKAAYGLLGSIMAIFLLLGVTIVLTIRSYRQLKGKDIETLHSMDISHSNDQHILSTRGGGDDHSSPAHLQVPRKGKRYMTESTTCHRVQFPAPCHGRLTGHGELSLRSPRHNIRHPRRATGVDRSRRLSLPQSGSPLRPPRTRTSASSADSFVSALSRTSDSTRSLVQ